MRRCSAVLLLVPLIATGCGQEVRYPARPSVKATEIDPNDPLIAGKQQRGRQNVKRFRPRLLRRLDCADKLIGCRNRADHKFDATCARRFLEQLSSLWRGVLGVDDGRHAARPRGPDQSEFPAACRQALWQGG